MGKLKPRTPETGERIRTHASSADTDDRKRPVFCFEHMVSGFCIDDCNRDEKAALADALFKRSKLTWGELKQSGRHQLGYEKIDRTALNKKIPKSITEDVQVIAFRFCGKAPMVGYRDREVFRVIWLDRSYPTFPKWPAA